MRETRKGDDEGALMVKGERCQQLEIAPLRNSSGRMEWEGCGVGVGGRERKGKRGMSTFVCKLEVEADERSYLCTVKIPRPFNLNQWADYTIYLIK
jgi:hypothetical protein